MAPRGFTLIELIIVISIISLLSGLAVVGIISAIESGRVHKTEQLISNLKTAIEFSEKVVQTFYDNEKGGFYFNADTSEKLLIRQKLVYDGALPSGNSIMLTNLLRLSRMTGQPHWSDYAEKLSRAFTHEIQTAPAAHTQFINGLSQADEGNIGQDKGS